MTNYGSSVKEFQLIKLKSLPIRKRPWFSLDEFKYCLHPLKNPPSLNSFSPNSSGPMPTKATPLAVRSASNLLISDAIHRHT